MFGRYSRVGALCLWLAPIAIAQGQDLPRLARALERAEKFDLGLGANPRPTAQWLVEDLNGLVLAFRRADRLGC